MEGEIPYLKVEVGLMEVWWVLEERVLCPSLSLMRDPPVLVLMYSRCEPSLVADPSPALLLLYHCCYYLGLYLLFLVPFHFQNMLWHLAMPWLFHQQIFLYMFGNLDPQLFCSIRKEYSTSFYDYTKITIFNDVTNYAKSLCSPYDITTSQVRFHS